MVYGEKVIARAPTSEELEKELERIDYDRPQYIFLYINPSDVGECYATA